MQNLRGSQLKTLTFFFRTLLKSEIIEIKTKNPHVGLQNKRLTNLPRKLVFEDREVILVFSSYHNFP